MHTLGVYERLVIGKNALLCFFFFFPFFTVFFEAEIQVAEAELAVEMDDMRLQELFRLIDELEANQQEANRAN